MAKKKTTHFESVIDLNNIDPAAARFDIDPLDLDGFEESEEDLEQDDPTNNDDIEVEIDDDDSNDETDDKPVTKKPKTQTKTDEEVASEQEAATRARKSASQERIRELANKNKTVLQEKLATDLRNKELEEEVIGYKKRVAEAEADTAAQELNEAKYAYAKAYEDGDAVAIAEANAKLSKASMRVELTNLKKNQTNSLTYDEDGFKKRTEATQQQIQNQPVEYTEEAPAIDENSQRWLKRNSFIFTNAGLTEAAGILFNQLKEDGYDVTEYDTYKELQERMIALYPQTDRLFNRKIKNNEYADMDEPSEPVKKKTPEAPPVANTTRTQANVQQPNQNYRVDSNGKVKYKPSADEVSMAKKMGVPIDVYVKNTLKLERSAKSGSKYTEIF